MPRTAAKTRHHESSVSPSSGLRIGAVADLRRVLDGRPSRSSAASGRADAMKVRRPRPRTRRRGFILGADQSPPHDGVTAGRAWAPIPTGPRSTAPSCLPGSGRTRRSRRSVLPGRRSTRGADVAGGNQSEDSGSTRLDRRTRRRASPALRGKPRMRTGLPGSRSTHPALGRRYPPGPTHTTPGMRWEARRRSRGLLDSAA